MKYIILILLTLLPLSAQAQEPFNPEGLWLTENKRSAIKVEKCESGLCGRIAWIIEGGMTSDTKNPKESLRGQPMCGLQIMQGLKQTSDKNKWGGGNIYKADDGDIYSASLKMNSAESLTVRGYMGISLLGKSQDWARVSKANYPQCKTPK